MHATYRWKDYRALLDCSGGEARRRSRSSARRTTFRGRSEATGFRDMATGSVGIFARRRLPDAGRGPSGRRQDGHPPNVQRKADQGPFSLHPLLAPHRESTEPEDPLIHSFGASDKQEEGANAKIAILGGAPVSRLRPMDDLRPAKGIQGLMLRLRRARPSGRVPGPERQPPHVRRRSGR